MGTGVYSSAFVPAAVIGVSAYTSISAGGNHTCGISGGRGFCWGSNSAGQLGYGGPPQNATPYAISSGSTNVQSVSAGDSSCAIIEGAIQCWGGNGYGQLGNNSSSNSNSPIQVYNLTSGGVAVSNSNFGHTCGIAAGTVYCWGQNTNYQLGNGDTINTLIPITVLNL